MIRLGVRDRRTIGPDGREAVEQLVECPSGGRLVQVDACSHCGYRRAGTPAEIVDCERGTCDPDDEGSFASTIRVVPIDDVANRTVIAASPSASAGILRAKMKEHVIGAIVIVDGTGAPVGIVSMHDLLDAPEDVRAEEIMKHPVLTMPQSAAITRAAALMAYEGLHHLPIVNDSGAVLAVLSSLDVVRYLAVEQGFMLGPKSIRRSARSNEPR